MEFEETQKSTREQPFLQIVPQNTTHSPSAVAHATRVLLLVQRIATMPPDVLATLFGIFNSTAGKPPSAP